MKKVMINFLICIVIFSITGCNKTAGPSTLDEIKNSTIARMELPDGQVAYVDSEIALLKTLADLEIIESSIEPDDSESDWLYRIVFNPSEKVKGSQEIIVSFHRNYIQINSEYYIASEGVSYETILEEWIQPKFMMFMDNLQR